MKVIAADPNAPVRIQVGGRPAKRVQNEAEETQDMSGKNPIYLPSYGPEAWRWRLASPAKHWRHGYSAMALAYTWEAADGWPADVAAALDTSPDLAGAELLVALPEHETPLPGGRRASQSDVFALARTPSREQVAMAVEGKAEESFGTQSIAEWRAGGSPGKQERLRYLLELLELRDDGVVTGLRYQLLHRTAAAVIEAQRFGARHAVMLVQSFSATNSWFDDYAVFARAVGAEPSLGAIAPAKTLGGIKLHLGWVSSRVPPAREPIDGILTERFDTAIQLARTLHAKQVRKGGPIPYIAHLLGVTSLVLEDGGDEDEAIAALLHDAVEDQGGPDTLALIRRSFGDRVADIVEACSDTDVEPKPPWRERKESYIEHLSSAERSALRVSLADKLHNARSILFDLREVGGAVWDRFRTGSVADQLWYYEALADAFAQRRAGPMAEELRQTVADIRAFASRLESEAT